MELRYTNCIRLQFYDKKVVINRNEILRCMVPLLRERGYGLDVIQAIGMLGNSYAWYVELSDGSVQKCLIGETAVLKDQRIIIEDAEDRTVIKTFRVTNLPRAGANAFLEANFKKFGTVISINDEMYEDNEFKVKLCTGNKYVKMKFNRDQQKRLHEIYGVKAINGQRFIIQMLGHKNCFLCGQTNHIKKDCPRKDLKCNKCKERGHEEAECTIARRLFKSNFEELCRLEDDDEGDGESIVTPKPTSEARYIESACNDENEDGNSISTVKNKSTVCVNEDKNMVKVQGTVLNVFDGERQKKIVGVCGKKEEESNNDHLLNQQVNNRFVSSTPSNNKRTTAERSPDEEKEDKKGRLDGQEAECSYLGNISDSDSEIEADYKD
jgi:hypothetical protein